MVPAPLHKLVESLRIDITYNVLKRLRVATMPRFVWVIEELLVQTLVLVFLQTIPANHMRGTSIISIAK